MRRRPDGDFDVLIIGGGPAGSSAAIISARLGLATGLLERSDHPGSNVGETLPPEAQIQLCMLGVWTEFQADGHLPSLGSCSAWGSNDLVERDSIFDPYGNGWHLDRPKFDNLLSRTAQKEGAAIFGCTNVLACYWDSRTKTWSIDATDAAKQGRIKFSANVLIVATGRRIPFTLPGNTGRIYHDRLIGLVRFYRRKDARTTETGVRTLVEGTKTGWWYSADLPCNRRVVTYFCDADLLPEGIRNSDDMWNRQLNGLTYTPQLLDGLQLEDGSYIRSAHTGRQSLFTGGCWLAVGDAAFTVDPLSSQGIVNGMNAGICAAESVAGYLGGDGHSIPAFADMLEQQFGAYLKSRDLYYSQEKRWPESKFWQRRSNKLETVVRRDSLIARLNSSGGRL